MAAGPSASRSPHIPPLVSDTIRILEQKALQEQGILRVSGSALQIEDLMKQYSKGKPVDLSKVAIHTIAGLLKRYFKDSPESLLTFDLYEDFIAATSIQDPAAKIEEIRNLVEQLPLANQEILHRLIVFLVRVSEFSDVNQMTKGNLSTMFGPQLLRTAAQDPTTMMQDMPKVFQVIHTLIENHKVIFPDWPDDQEFKPGFEVAAASVRSGGKASNRLENTKKMQKTIEKAIEKWYGKNWKADLQFIKSLQHKVGIQVPVDRPRSQSSPVPESGLIQVIQDPIAHSSPQLGPPEDRDSSSSSSSTSSSSSSSKSDPKADSPVVDQPPPPPIVQQPPPVVDQTPPVVDQPSPPVVDQPPPPPAIDQPPPPPAIDQPPPPVVQQPPPPPPISDQPPPPPPVVQQPPPPPVLDQPPPPPVVDLPPPPPAVDQPPPPPIIDQPLLQIVDQVAPTDQVPSESSGSHDSTRSDSSNSSSSSSSTSDEGSDEDDSGVGDESS